MNSQRIVIIYIAICRSLVYLVYLDSCVCIVENNVMLSVSVWEDIKVVLVSFLVLVLSSSLLITSVS